MSDTTVTNIPPPISADSPPISNPSVREVPINQNPVNSPNPVGNQAPDKPRSISESIQRAFDRANKTPQAPERKSEREAPKPAEAKAGHNNPPEPTKAEKTERPERIDLRKRPSDQPREQGRFAPRQRDDANDNAALRQAPAAPGQTGQTGQDAEPWRKLPETTPYRQPPQRMGEKAKAEWHTAPESVRGEVHRMQEEFVKAYRVYKNDFDEMSKIRHFHKMATDHGTTLEKALTNYTGMEQKLRADPVAGLDMIVNNLNLQTPNGEKLGLRDIAYHVLSQSPDQLRQLQMGNQQHAASQQIGALHQEIQGLKSTLHQMHYQQQHTQTRSAVDNFADSHPRFDELGPAIQRELGFGFDLDTAYRRAEMLHPANTVPQTHTPSAQTRQVDRSISGSRDAGPSNGTSRRPRAPSATPRDAVQNAIRRLNGSL